MTFSLEPGSIRSSMLPKLTKEKEKERE